MMLLTNVVLQTIMSGLVVRNLGTLHKMLGSNLITTNVPKKKNNNNVVLHVKNIYNFILIRNI